MLCMLCDRFTMFRLPGRWSRSHCVCAHAGLQKHYPDEKRRVAILTPYKAQMRKLRSVFTASVASAQLANVDFATVDGFQVRGRYCLCPRPTLPGGDRHAHDQGSGCNKFGDMVLCHNHDTCMAPALCGSQPCHWRR